MNEISILDLQNLRHLIGGCDTTHCKMQSYAQEATDPKIKQFFEKIPSTYIDNGSTRLTETDEISDIDSFVLNGSTIHTFTDEDSDIDSSYFGGQTIQTATNEASDIDSMKASTVITRQVEDSDWD